MIDTVRFAAALLLCASLQGAAPAAAPRERVFYDGKVFTAEPAHPRDLPDDEARLPSTGAPENPR